MDLDYFRLFLLQLADGGNRPPFLRKITHKNEKNTSIFPSIITTTVGIKNKDIYKAYYWGFIERKSAENEKVSAAKLYLLVSRSRRPAGPEAYSDASAQDRQKHNIHDFFLLSTFFIYFQTSMFNQGVND